MLLWKIDQFKRIAPQGDGFIMSVAASRLVCSSCGHRHGDSDFSLDLTVRSIRCSELSLGCCPPEALWQTFDQRWFVFSTRTDSESG